jgi:hypothetical protein
VTTLLANAPVEPAVLFKEEVDDLLLEARNYLDGEPIANEEQANAVSSLLNRLRRVAKDADAARADEKRPHDERGKEVQAKWKPIIDKADLAASTAKQALAPWLLQIEEQQQREAEVARQEADRLARIAQENRKRRRNEKMGFMQRAQQAATASGLQGLRQIQREGGPLVHQRGQAGLVYERFRGRGHDGGVRLQP